MRHFLTALTIAFLAIPTLYAQTVVHQSDDVNNVVNGTKPSEPSNAPQPAAQKPAESSSESKSGSSSSSSSSSSSETRRATEQPKPKEKTEAEKKKEREKRIKEREARDAERDRRILETEKAAGATATTKKVMSNGRRVMGYRVQVYSGKNTRADREKAMEAGRKIKSQMPGQPVYVHFYSPRWVCRIGNFAKEDEAINMVKKVKNMGFRNACVVKTVVTVSVRRR